MNSFFKISFIGSGNVAWHLSQALENQGHSIIEIYSRNTSNAGKLCSKLYEAVAKKDLDFLQSKPEIIIIAVSDKAISSIVNGITVPNNTIVLHTSGTEDIDVFGDLNCPYGVLYPIQTFSQSRMVDFKQIPFSLECSDEESTNKVEKLATSLSNKIFFHTTKERRVVHLASVFAANFINHMLTISKGLLESNSLSFELIKPLILQVIQKAFAIGPEHAQTGPAIRNDFNTIEKHLEYLSEEESLVKIYKAVTEDIIRTY